MSLTKEQKIEILKRCQNSFIYFCENFCKIRHPSAGELPFLLHSYQKKSVATFKKHNRVLYRKCRQCGISTLVGCYVLWFAMFHSNKKVLIVSKRDEDAMAFLDKQIKFVYENLKMAGELFYPIFGDPRNAQNRKFNPPKTYNEHTIVFPNGSDIRSLTSSKDTLRSNAASLVVIDEAAFIPDMETMWCVPRDSLILTDDGISKIGDYVPNNLGIKESTPANFNVITDSGIKNASAAHNNGVVDTIKIKTKLGYEFEGSPKHKIKVLDEDGKYDWKMLSDIDNEDLAALYVGGASDFNGENVVQNVIELVDVFVKNIKLMNDYFLEVPNSILKSKEAMLLCIKKLFEMNTFCTVSNKLHNQIKTMLLSFGIVTYSYIYEDKYHIINYDTKIINSVYFDEIESISNGKCETVDISVPSNNTYIANGFISHNTAGQPTLMHGGGVILITTTNGKGGWYYNTYEDALAGNNEFEVVEIPWYEMDWAIEYNDSVTGKKQRIAPCDGIVECTTEEDKSRYGKYKSPWLEKQYRELQEKGEPWKFRQEILMEFIGAGNTVLGRDALLKVAEDIDNTYKILDKPVSYVNENANIEGEYLDFQKGLWIWNMPIRKVEQVVHNGKIIKPGDDGHRYVIGADVSTGEASDWSALEIIDVTAQEQVAELKIKVEMHTFSKMIDYLGRLYNNALVVVERNGGYGESVIQDLRKLYYYPNLYYRRMPNGKKDKKSGFPTSQASKGFIVKALCENIGTVEGIKFKSSRFNQEINIFIHLGGGRVGNDSGAGNNDDLVIGGGLALIGMIDALQTSDGLIPSSSVNMNMDTKIELDINDMIKKGGRDMMYPIIKTEEQNVAMTTEQEMMKFMTQLGGIPVNSAIDRKAYLPPVVMKKY